MKLPAQATIKNFLHVKPDFDGSPVFRLFTCDMSGADGFIGYACLGPVELVVDVPQIDPRAAMIAGLEQQIELERANSQLRVNALLDRLGKLQCLEYQPEGEA